MCDFRVLSWFSDRFARVGSMQGYATFSRICGTRVGEMLVLKVIFRITNFLLTTSIEMFRGTESAITREGSSLAQFSAYKCTLHAVVKEKHGKRIVCCRCMVVNLQNRAKIKLPEDCLRHVLYNHNLLVIHP